MTATQTRVRPRPASARTRQVPSAQTRGRTRRPSLYARAAAWATEEAPWEYRDFVWLCAMVALGFGGLVGCWFAMSGNSNWHEQIPWLGGAALSLAVTGMGVTRWLLVGLRAVHGDAYEVVDAIREHKLGLPPEAPDSEFDAQPVVSDSDALAQDGWVVGAGMTRIHRPGCPMVGGKSVGFVDRHEAELQGYTVCGVCGQ